MISLDGLFSYLIKNDYVRAQILAAIRGFVKVLGTSLIAKGLADSAVVESAAGFATVVVGFYLSQQDVKTVDTKIETALATNTIVVTPVETPVTTSPYIPRIGKF